MRTKLFASASYLVLYVPHAVYFDEDRLPPYSTVVAVLIVVASPLLGYAIGYLWALAVPLIPWTAALILIAIAPADDFGEVTRQGSMLLWSFVFLVITGLVLVGLLIARRTEADRARTPYG